MASTAAPVQTSTTTWNIDPAHSMAEFKVKHMMIANVKGQFLLGYTPNPGTAFYVGYNDDINRHGFNPFSGALEPGLRRNSRTFFIKASYLFRKSF